MSDIKMGDRVIATQGKNHIEGEVTYLGANYLDIKVADDEVVSIQRKQWVVKVDIPAEPEGYFPVVKFKYKVPAVRDFDSGRWHFVATPQSTHTWAELVVQAGNNPFVVLYSAEVDPTKDL